MSRWGDGGAHSSGWPELMARAWASFVRLLGGQSQLGAEGGGGPAQPTGALTSSSAFRCGWRLAEPLLCRAECPLQQGVPAGNGGLQPQLPGPHGLKEEPAWRGRPTCLQTPAQRQLRSHGAKNHLHPPAAEIFPSSLAGGRGQAKKGLLVIIPVLNYSGGGQCRGFVNPQLPLWFPFLLQAFPNNGPGCFQLALSLSSFWKVATGFVEQL